MQDQLLKYLCTDDDEDQEPNRECKVNGESFIKGILERASASHRRLQKEREKVKVKGGYEYTVSTKKT